MERRNYIVKVDKYHSSICILGPKKLYLDSKDTLKPEFIEEFSLYNLWNFFIYSPTKESKEAFELSLKQSLIQLKNGNMLTYEESRFINILQIKNPSYKNIGNFFIKKLNFGMSNLCGITKESVYLLDNYHEIGVLKFTDKEFSQAVLSNTFNLLIELNSSSEIPFSNLYKNRIKNLFSLYVKLFFDTIEETK